MSGYICKRQEHDSSGWGIATVKSRDPVIFPWVMWKGLWCRLPQNMFLLVWMYFTVWMQFFQLSKKLPSSQQLWICRFCFSFIKELLKFLGSLHHVMWTSWKFGNVKKPSLWNYWIVYVTWCGLRESLEMWIGYLPQKKASPHHMMCTCRTMCFNVELYNFVS